MNIRSDNYQWQEKQDTIKWYLVLRWNGCKVIFAGIVALRDGKDVSYHNTDNNINTDTLLLHDQAPVSWRKYGVSYHQAWYLGFIAQETSEKLNNSGKPCCPRIHIEHICTSKELPHVNKVFLWWNKLWNLIIFYRKKN